MDSRVITITSGKGGVGKTTTTANLGTALAMQGKKVAVVDSDIGLRNLDAVLGLENRIVYDLVDVVEGQCRLRQALIKDKRLPELYLLPAAQTRDKNAINSIQMEQLCQQLRQEFDFVLIDSPAGIEQGIRNGHRVRTGDHLGHMLILARGKAQGLLLGGTDRNVNRNTGEELLAKCPRPLALELLLVSRVAGNR